MALIACFIHLTRSFPGLLGTLSAYFSIIYPWSNVDENTMYIDTTKTVMYNGVKNDTYTLWSNKQCTQFVQKTNLLQFYTKNPEKDGPIMVPKYDDLASQICYGLEFSMGGQVSCWISTLFMFATVLYILTHNDGDIEKDGFDCPIYNRFGKSSQKNVNNDSGRSGINANSKSTSHKKQSKKAYNDMEENESMAALLDTSKSNDIA